MLSRTASIPYYPDTMNDRCPSCQSERLEEARVMGAGVQPLRASNWAKALAAAEISARVCLDCGHMDQFRADPERLRKMVGEG